MASKSYKRIGILGGMGPAATADLYLAIVALCQQRYGARYDSDYPQMIINSIPAPDVVERLVVDRLPDEARLVAMLEQGVQTLESAGADFVVVACNTVHVFHAAMASAVSIPVVDLVEETVAEVHRAGHGSVGLLATGMTMDSGIYRRSCQRRGVDLLEPDEHQQQRLTELIMDILAGRHTQQCTARLTDLMAELQNQGSEAVILGCTDLSAVAPDPFPIPLYDTTQILARAALREATSPPAKTKTTSTGS
jgi:aspartate racemase